MPPDDLDGARALLYCGILASLVWILFIYLWQNS